MIATWKKTKLGDVIDTLKGGVFKSEDYISSGVPIVRVSDFTEDSISESELFYINENLAKKYSKYRLEHNNIIIQTVGSWQNNPASVVGKVVKVPKNLSGSLLNQNSVKIIPKENVDELFLYYRLKDESFKSHNLGCAQGAANQASITLSTINDFSFLIPSFSIQKKIAAILSAYDDLIENNLKQIRLLEEMAQITYQEWFVRLKFPNHENTPIDETTGLPIGWEYKKLGDLTSYINRGISPSYVENNGIPVINQKCIRNNFVNFKESRLTSIQKSIPKDKLLNKFDILINSTGTGTLGRVAQLFETDSSATVDTHVTIIRANSRISQLYLGRALESIEGFIESLGKGATNQQELSRTDLVQIIELLVPNKDLQNKYDDLVIPIYEAITFYRKQNQLLNEARDILLPRLMTGKIPVE